jgi:hypothetical protein
VFEHLNKLPSAAHGTDIMRVREAFLSGSAACYRQTLLSASFAAPQFNALLKARCCCWQGKVRLASRPAGVLGQVVPQVRALGTGVAGRGLPPQSDGLSGSVAWCQWAAWSVQYTPNYPQHLPHNHRATVLTLQQVRQMFERFTPAEPTRLPEARFDFFRTALWPRLQEGASGGGLLLVVPDYLDFLRLR